MPLYKFWIDKFYQLQDKGFCPYSTILKSSVAKDILHKRYNGFVSDKEITSIELLPKEKKQFYWDISLKLMPDETNNELRIRTAKAAYTLSLITSND